MDLNPLLAAMGALVLERLDRNAFVRRGALPDWAFQLSAQPLHEDAPFDAEEIFPFLSSFWDQAERVWSGQGRRRRSSDFWTEVGTDGRELHLEATAVQHQNASMLLVMENNRLFLQGQLLLQRARELRLAHDALTQRLEHEEILVHTIVHDLASPLHSILGALSLLEEDNPGVQSLRWIQIGLLAAQRQRDLIHEILAVFTAESEVATRAGAGTAAVDADEVISDVLSELSPVARQRGVALETSIRTLDNGVTAEKGRLVRVLTNLVDNGLRYSARGGTVRIVAQRSKDMVEISVEDQGPGVPVDVLPNLFEKFAQGGARGNVGLGLYYCRITVEGWGGGIGYEPRAEGGSRFWIRLPRPEMTADDILGESHGQTADSR